jgi:hypothetical protein
MAVQKLPVRQSAELQRRKLNADIDAIAALQALSTTGGTALPAAPAENWVFFVLRDPPNPVELHYSFGGAWEQLV